MADDNTQESGAMGVSTGETASDSGAIAADVQATDSPEQVADRTESGEGLAQKVDASVDAQPGNATGTESGKLGTRAQKVGIVASDKMTKTVVVRVDRLIKHPKYRRYVRRTSKFMAHDDTGATIGDKVRIVETRPMSARKRWRVIEIVQKAAK